MTGEEVFGGFGLPKADWAVSTFLRLVHFGILLDISKFLSEKQ
jgi:hypothetical protein